MSEEIAEGQIPLPREAFTGIDVCNEEENLSGERCENQCDFCKSRES